MHHRAKNLPELCAANQWTAEVFWRNLHLSVKLAEAQLNVVLDEESEARVERAILAEWLDYAHEAGTA
jgi:hypothetical protein